MITNEIENFKGFLEIEQRSKHTLRQYLATVIWFEQFLIETNIEYSNLKEKDLVKFQIWLKRKHVIKEFNKQYNRTPTLVEYEEFSKKCEPLSGKSIYKYITTVRKFLEVNDKSLNWTKIPSPKFDENFNPEVLTREDISKIASIAENFCTYLHKPITVEICQKCKKYRFPKNYKSSVQRPYPNICFYYDGIKLKAMILIAYEAALRTDELCNLKLRHLDIEKKEIFIEKPLKHSQPQAIPISSKLTQTLKQYLDTHQYIKNEEDILFPTKTGKKYHPNNFATHVFRPIATAAGYDVRYYTLRHSRATNLLKQGLDIGWVRRITRHRNINNVLKYIHLTSQDIRKELEKKDIF